LAYCRFHCILGDKNFPIQKQTRTSRMNQLTKTALMVPNSENKEENAKPKTKSKMYNDKNIPKLNVEKIALGTPINGD